MTTSPPPAAQDQRLDRELASLDPAPATATPEIARSLELLSLRLHDESARNTAWRQSRRTTGRTRGRRIRWTVIGLVVALTAAFGAGPATAAVSRWLAHTGLFGTNFSPTRAGAAKGSEGDTSEWIGLNASDTGKALAGLYPAYLVLPNGITKNDAIRTIIRLNKASLTSGDAAHATRVEEQAVGIHETYEFFANCAWYSSWLAADKAGDSSQLARATAGIETAAHFPALASTSPDVTTRLVMFAKDAVSGNRADIKEASKELGCTLFLKGAGK